MAYRVVRVKRSQAGPPRLSVKCKGSEECKTPLGTVLHGMASLIIFSPSERFPSSLLYLGPGNQTQACAERTLAIEPSLRPPVAFVTAAKAEITF